MKKKKILKGDVLVFLESRCKKKKKLGTFKLCPLF